MVEVGDRGGVGAWEDEVEGGEDGFVLHGEPAGGWRASDHAGGVEFSDRRRDLLRHGFGARHPGFGDELHAEWSWGEGWRRKGASL